MSDDKGPKIELPPELVDELEHPGEEPRDEPAGAEEIEEASPAGSAAEGAPAEETSGEGASGAEPCDEGSLQARLDDARDKYLRLAADFENYKRRARREREELFNYANENLIKELLETVDNLERALDHAQQAGEEGDGKTLLEGVELTHRSLMQALEKLGVLVVSPQGEEFDPNVHEAVRQVPSEAHAAGLVVEVLQKGYLLKDRLLRPALVVVSSGS
jgi:molecular chaperone GrpE